MTDIRKMRWIGLVMLVVSALTELLTVLCYERGALVMSHYTAPMVFAFAGMTLLSGLYQRHKELWLGAAFCAWYVLSRVLMGELYIELSYLYFCNLCMCYLLALPFAHTMQDERQVALKAFAWVYFLAFGVLAWMSLLLALRGTIITLPYLDTRLGLQAVDKRLVINLHPNGSAVLLLIGLMLGVWLLVKHRRRWLILPAAVLMAGMYVAIGFTVSRTVMIQCGCFIGGAAAVLCLRMLKGKPLWKKLLAAAPVAMVIVLVVFLSFGWMTDAADRLNDAMSAGAEAFSGTAALEAGNDPLVAERDFLGDLVTLTGRTTIWKGIFQLMKDHPRTLLTGLLNSDIEGVLRNYTAHTHAHNSILHALCNMGLPGMLIAVFLTIRTAVCALRLIFHQKAAFSDQLLAVMLLVWLLGSITESSLFVESFTSCFLPFLLTLGYALEAEKQLSE